jgi:hypothetical protein
MSTDRATSAEGASMAEVEWFSGGRAGKGRALTLDTIIVPAPGPGE